MGSGGSKPADDAATAKTAGKAATAAAPKKKAKTPAGKADIPSAMGVGKTSAGKAAASKAADDPPPPAEPDVDPATASGWLGDAIFKGLAASPAQKAKAAAYVKHMETQHAIPYLNTKGLLLAFRRTQQWRIFLHFTDWEGKVTAQAVASLRAKYQWALNQWLSKLKGYNDFPSAEVRVKIFGFVFCKGVEWDASFDAKYGSYPRVSNWTPDGEKTPWTLEAEADGSGKPTPMPMQNFYRKDLDLSRTRVTGYRSDVPDDAVYSPAEWWGAEAKAKHGEGVDGFDTRFWLGTEWNAVAQRHYLRLGGSVTDYAKGTLGVAPKEPKGALPPGEAVLLHEMGHCFFLDDMYDDGKYPRPLPACQCTLKAADTIMFNTGLGLQTMDHVMLRRSWDVQRKKYA